MKTNKGKQLIDELHANPSLFFKQGKSYNLLNEFFDGYPFEALIPLLQSDNVDIIKSSLWLVSELATQACSLLPYVVQLVNSEEPYIRYYSLECVVLCGKGDNIKEFIHLIKGISDKDDTVRIPAMYLLSNAELTQIEAAVRLVKENKIADYLLHQIGLTQLLIATVLLEKEVIDLMCDKEPLLQQYGVMIAKRLYKTNPELLNHALLSTNPDVKEFAKTELDLV
jgi:ABC-type amino acid transport substrate-binding protein